MADWPLNVTYASGAHRRYSLPTRDKMRTLKRSLKQNAQAAGVPIFFPEA